MNPTPKTVAVLSRYSAWHRRADLLAIGLFGAAAAWNLARLGVGWGESQPLWLLAVAAMLAWLVVDLLSGVVHWAFDTWGSVHTPLVGARFIRPFREHHWDPHAMTRHDFVETNGSSCLAALLMLGVAAALPADSGLWAMTRAIFVFVALGVVITNQCHKWAHLPLAEVPRHHVRPFDSHYCTAAGWLNRPLAAIGFFRALERAIGALTRACAREDDLA
jgi:ubiquitin-conjugating enzyme E2 variant